MCPKCVQKLVPQDCKKLKNLFSIKSQIYLAEERTMSCKNKLIWNPQEFDIVKPEVVAAIKGAILDDEMDDETYYEREANFIFRSQWLIYLESSKVQVSSKVDKVVGNKDLQRFIAEYI